MKLGVGIKLGTNLALTPQLQQAIRMLQLSSIELEQAVEQELYDNPLLERDNGDFETNEGFNSSDNEYSEHKDTEYSNKTDTLDHEFSEPQLKDDLGVDTQWEDVYIHESTKWDVAAQNDTDFQGQTSDSIHSHLTWQMNLVPLSPIDTFICERLIDSIDENGFISVDLSDLHENIALELTFAGIDYDLELAEIQVVLKRLQQCEPLGIAARNLAESLQIQLRSLYNNNDFFQDAMVLLDNHTLLIKNDLKSLLKNTGLNLEKIQECIALIRELNPFPAQDFTAKETSYQIPDVLVKKLGDTWQVQLNPDTLPKLRINNSYANMIQDGRKKHSDNANTTVQTSQKDNANEFLKANLTNAKHFIRSIDERNNSLLKVATAIVETQAAFFTEGATALKPLILSDVATMVDLHESTVSRITTNKYMLTANGMYELKYFFSSSVSSDTGDDHSSTAISALIKSHIEQEDNKKPLSDSKITQLLQEQGIEVARRTVAKYREALGYGSSTERKRLL